MCNRSPDRSCRGAGMLRGFGLFTLARLLADLEPFRLRWALQHWPYPIVKLTRSLISSPAKPTPAVLAGETELLKTAWERLRLEERLDEDGPRREAFIRDVESRLT